MFLVVVELIGLYVVLSRGLIIRTFDSTVSTALVTCCPVIWDETEIERISS